MITKYQTNNVVYINKIYILLFLAAKIICEMKVNDEKILGIDGQ
jgi:hypothetical protein